METVNKKINWVLWIGLAIPVIVLILVAIFSYMPTSLVVRHDFLFYSKSYGNYCGGVEINTYKVKDQKISAITKSDLLPNLPKDSSCYSIETDLPKIYRYNVLTDEKTQISLAEAQKLQLDNSPISSDNITIQNGSYSNNGIFELFGSNNNYNNMYFKNDKGNLRKINLGSIVASYYNFAFIGWVL